MPKPAIATKECGTLIVPLDYDTPAGATLEIAVARIPATDQANRLGGLSTCATPHMAAYLVDRAPRLRLEMRGSFASVSG